MMYGPPMYGPPAHGHIQDYWQWPGYWDGYVGASRSRVDSAYGSGWSTTAKVGIVLGGALMIYVIYAMTKAVAPVHERVGGAAADFLAARAGGKGALLGEFSKASKALGGKARAFPALPGVVNRPVNRPANRFAGSLNMRHTDD